MTDLPLERRAHIDLAAVRHNVRALKERVRRPDGTAPLLMAVVKADAYGHGAVPVARAALEAGADRLGVAHASEALALRAAGVEGPILAWLHTRDTPFAAALAADVALGVSGWEIEPIAEAARAAGRPATVHLKLDTGLGRNGCTPAELPALARRAAALEAEGVLRVEGVFSHLAVADEPDRAAETDAQLAVFEAGVAVLREAGLAPRVRHLANTPATLSRPDTHLDMVRVGLGLYGLSPFPDRAPADFGLLPAMSLRTTLAAVKAVPAGQGVSYGHLHRTAEPTVLGLVPLGYADGVPRVAQDAPVDVAGRRLRAVGRIAMDQFVVDLGPGATERVGDPVELFGPASGISADAWAEAAGTINYELVTRIGGRVPREHVDTERAGAEAEAGDPGAGAGGAEAGPGAPGLPAAALSAVVPLEGAAGTRDFGRRLARVLGPGDVVILTGDLGAGKTTLTQGLGEGLGVREGVISPTFVLARIHPAPSDGPDLVHVDAYRLRSAAELADLGLEDTLDRSVTVVEWGRGLAEPLAGFPEDPEASWLDVEIVRARGGEAAPSARPDSGGPVIVTDFSDEEGEAAEELRSAVVTGYGPRWRGVRLP